LKAIVKKPHAETSGKKAFPPWIRFGAATGRALDSRWVRQMAAEAGLAVAAIASADPLRGLDAYLVGHIERGLMLGLDWFTSDRARFSADPHNLHPAAKSIIAVGLPYLTVDPGKPEDGVARGRIARYAWGADYHDILKRRMRGLHAALESQTGRSIEGRCLVDTARTIDRAVAASAGLGWYGKNSCLISPGHGSWLLLGELVVDLDLEPDEPLPNTCGRCSICLDNCPTGAIVAPYTVETPKCLSFQTIEQRGPIPTELRAKAGDWVFGCDVCQEVCPYTGAAKVINDKELMPRNLENCYPSLTWLLSMSEAEYRAVYRGTAVRRAKRRGLARNAAVALGNVGDERHLSVLATALETHDEPLVRGHAAWALARVGGPAGRARLERAWRTETDGYVRAEIGHVLGC
jgi:epoxyqueuosine reductase